MELGHAVRKRLVALCKEKETDLYEVCQKGGCSIETMIPLALGETKSPQVKTIAKIAKGLNMSLADFFDSQIFSKVKY